MSKLYDGKRIHESWHPFFTKEIISDLKKIESQLNGIQYNPETKQVLRFAKTDLTKCKVIILGQDPYWQEDTATGRAFEVANLTAWSDSIGQASLRNILKELYREKNGKLITFKEIRKKIDEKSFAIKPPNEIFDYWEDQGVLMLNTYLTSETGNRKSGSHKDIWEEFAGKLLRHILSEKPSATWFLWGNKAQDMMKPLNPKKVCKSKHPSLNGYGGSDDFLGSNCFKKTKDIDWIGDRG
jgi:uracil-DNA glycosylase